MSNPYTRQYIWIIAGGYVAYVGARLIRDELETVNPKTYAFVGGALFILAGAAIILFAVLTIRRERAEADANAEPLPEDDDDRAIDTQEAQETESKSEEDQSSSGPSVSV